MPVKRKDCYTLYKKWTLATILASTLFTSTLLPVVHASSVPATTYSLIMLKIRIVTMALRVGRR